MFSLLSFKLTLVALRLLELPLRPVMQPLADAGAAAITHALDQKKRRKGQKNQENGVAGHFQVNFLDNFLEYFHLFK